METKTVVILSEAFAKAMTRSKVCPEPAGMDLRFLSGPRAVSRTRQRNKDLF
jgi:hypothetical protein